MRRLRSQSAEESQLDHLNTVPFPVYRLPYQDRIHLGTKYKEDIKDHFMDRIEVIEALCQAWIEEETLEDFLASCPQERDGGGLLSADCDADMCREEGRHSDIFISRRGEFRRRMVTTLKCLSNENNCVTTLERDTNKDCRADSFKNLDSGQDCQCSWTEPSEQAECLERMYQYQPAAFTPSQIICCRDNNSTVFSLKKTTTATARHSDIEICSEEHLSKCKQKWTSWSGWEV